MNLPALPDRRATENPSGPAVADDDIDLTNAEFLAAVQRAAATLQRHGVSAGDVVAIMLPNTVAFVVSLFASWRLGAAVTPVNPALTAQEARYQIDDAGATLVGQSLGAGKPERAERAVWRAGAYNAVFLSVVGIGFVVFAAPLVGLFTQEAAVAAIAVQALRIISAGFLFYAYGMVLTAAFNGAGDTFTPTMLNLGVFWLFEIPLAYALARPLSLGPTGAFIAVAVAFSVLALLSGLLFRRGTWKSRKV